MISRPVPSRKFAGVSALLAVLSLGAAIAYAADVLVIDKNSIRVESPLNFGNRLAPLLNLWSSTYTIGMQPSTMYFRTDKNFGWFKGGKQDAATGQGELDAGGGTALMSLSSEPAAGKGTLDVGGTITSKALHVDAGIKAKSIEAKSIKVNENDLVARIDELQEQMAALKTAIGERLSSTDGKRLRVIRGTIKGQSGYPDIGEGFTLQRMGEGLFDISFNIPFKDIPSATATQIFTNEPNYGGGDTRDNVVIVYLSTGKMRIIAGDSSGNRRNRTFSFIVIGPQ